MPTEIVLISCKFGVSGESMEKIRLQALILDYGGVVSLPQNRENIDFIIERLNQDYDDFIQVYYDLRAGYDNGQLSGQEFWLKVLQHYGLNPNGFDLDRFIREDVKSWTHLNQSILRFITENRTRIPKLAMISNMVTDTLVYMRRNYDWLSLFDELVFSCEIGVNKPDREIYEICMQQLKVNPQDCLFVDDSANNIKGAREVGMNCVLYESFPQFMIELQEKYQMFS
jgi:putative hydrolase of the HAD superfamily